MATTLGVLNPFRYRGYVYDEETQWYYLRSRYYDPEACRFISADVLLSTGQGVIGHNSFTYCGNNPIGRIDSEGELWNIIIGAIAGAVIGAIDAAINPDATASDIVKGALIGAATGAVVGATLGFGTALVAAEVVTPVVGATIATVGGALASGTGEIVRQNAFNEERDWGKIGVATVAGGVGNLAGFGIGRFVSKTVKGLEAVVKKPLATMVKTLTSKGANATAERLINLVISDLWIAPMQSATMRIVSSLR